MNIRLLEGYEKETYNHVYEDIFDMSPTSLPAVIYIAETDNKEPIGFVAGHTNFDGSFYIEYAGITKEFRRKGYIRYLNIILGKIDGNGHFLCATEHTNTMAMKILISIGFIPIGGRLSNDKYHIEWSR